MRKLFNTRLILVLILAIAVGAVGAIIAILFQKAAIVIAGFAAGGYIVLTLFGQFAGFLLFRCFCSFRGVPKYRSPIARGFI